MALLRLQMALGSSSQAAAGTLAQAGRDAQARRPPTAASSSTWPAGPRDQHESTKVDRLLELLAEYPDKMVIFTQFRATQEMLARTAASRPGHDVAVFHGGLSRLAKEAAIERFRGPARLLLCTEAGSEGRNLQFAHAVCNFDLPWNPMRIEQRIGRLSRIGQTHDVHVFNLVAAGTVEAAVLHLLEAKLNLFELVIGEIDMILGNLDEEREFQDVVADLWAESADPDDFTAAWRSWATACWRPRRPTSSSAHRRQALRRPLSPPINDPHCDPEGPPDHEHRTMARHSLGRRLPRRWKSSSATTRR